MCRCSVGLFCWSVVLVFGVVAVCLFVCLVVVAVLLWCFAGLLVCRVAVLCR